MSFWTTTKRVARYGFIGFLRNGFVSLSAILIMSITLFVVSALVITGAALTSVLHQISDKVDVTVYFTVDATQDQFTTLQTSLKALPEVAAITFKSRDQALADFQNRHKNDQLTMQALEEIGANPLGASLEIRAKDPSQYATITQYLENLRTASPNTGIDKINFYQNKDAIERLSQIIQASRSIGIAVAVILGLASLLISFNTIRLAIYTARDEIGVMNLVGASHWYVRGPFMVSGVMYGVTSGILILLLLYPLTAWIGPGSERFFVTFNVYTYYTSHFALLLLVVLGSGIGLGALSSYLAVRRYLR